ncbi:MAG: DUF998 domain-containing protein [Saprospiraceae bacterium]|nr:DUF998 domain-containing protein [Saprospiraceae bacterium]
MTKQSGTEKENENALVISYLALRQSIGYVGIGMPCILAIGSVILGNCNEIQESISAYYHTVMRDVFVAILSAIAFFLYSYKGYDARDNVLSKLAALFAVGIALFPCRADLRTNCYIDLAHVNVLAGRLHLFFAVLFFLVLTYISLFQFTQTTDSKMMTNRKKDRNKIYRVCGYVMLGCLIAIALYWLWLEKRFQIWKD